MEVRLHRKHAAPLPGLDAAVADVQQRLHALPNDWLQQLQARPESFADLERTIHHTFRHLADQVVAGLLAQATAPPAFAQDAQKK